MSKELRHKRLHLDTGRGLLLGWNPDTRAEERFDLPAELRAEKGKAEPLAVLHRHLADDGQVTVDAFASVGFEDRFKPADRELLTSRAKEINGADTVDFSRVIRGRWSLQTPNRSGIVVPNAAWDLEKFNTSNPIGAWNHRTSFSAPEMIVARWLWAGHKTSSVSSDLVGFEEFAPADVNPMASTVLGLYRFGALNAFSPGFLVSFVDFGGEDDDVTFGSKDDPNELVEISNVPIGRHPDAVLMALGSGEVDAGPLREFIAHQLEVAYSDPMQIRETAFFEAVGKKLGLVGASVLLDMSAEDVEALELPSSGESPGLASAWVNALRTADGSELPEVNHEAFERYRAGFEGMGASDVTDAHRVVAARVAGLAEGAEALAAVMTLEAGTAEPEVEAEEHSAEENSPEEPEGETNAAEPVGGAGGLSVEEMGLTIETFTAAVRSGLEPIRTATENRTGRLIVN